MQIAELTLLLDLQNNAGLNNWLNYFTFITLYTFIIVSHLM